MTGGRILQESLFQVNGDTISLVQPAEETNHKKEVSSEQTTKLCPSRTTRLFVLAWQRFLQVINKFVQYPLYNLVV